MSAIDGKLIDRLFRLAKGERWHTPTDDFRRALDASAGKAFAGRTADPREVERYLSALHLEDLALACACAAGDDEAWEHFVRTQRPLLYRAADALDPGGGARDLADALYGDLFGLQNDAGERRSLFRYFHGRSSLTTWLRAVLAQRHVDRLRARRRLEGLPEDDSAFAIPAPAKSVEPDRDRYLSLVRGALERAVGSLTARDRLRLACYYGQQLTLAQTGRMLGEHEATASRALGRTRTAVRRAVETQLREEHGLTGAEIARCLECVTEDAGTLDLSEMLDLKPGTTAARKKPVADRSN